MTSWAAHRRLGSFWLVGQHTFLPVRRPVQVPAPHLVHLVAPAEAEMVCSTAGRWRDRVSA